MVTYKIDFTNIGNTIGSKPESNTDFLTLDDDTIGVPQQFNTTQFFTGSPLWYQI